MNRDQLIEVVEATWPPECQFEKGPWVFRQSDGGGKRVTAASSSVEPSIDDIRLAEAKMAQRGQQILFTLSPDQRYDALLADAGYQRVDETLMYQGAIGLLADRDVPPVTAFPVWPPLQLAREIWADGGIGADRVSVMERANCEKTCILGRVNDRAGGVVYAALFNGCVMIHALEVLPQQRRYGLATSLMAAAAQWGLERGGTDIALLVTKQNTGANAFYSRLGMSSMQGYHYRIKL